MRRSKKTCLAITFLISFLFAPGIFAQGFTSADYIIFRGWISPMYIQNVSAPIKVMAIPYQNNKPFSAQLTVVYQVRGLNVDYELNGTESVISGRISVIYLPPMQQGHYEITIYARYGGVTSRKMTEDFAVSPPPDPYELSITPDGSVITFKSKVLNETGHIDPNVTFRLEIYVYEHGLSESLVTSYDGITNLTIRVPEEWRHGILIVEVVDRWGWRNGMGIDISQFRFYGPPLQYDYYYSHREPFASRQIWYLVAAIVLIIVLAIILGWYYTRGGSYGYGG